MSEVLDIEYTVSEKRVEEHLNDDEQSGLSEFGRSASHGGKRVDDEENEDEGDDDSAASN